MFVTFEGIEGCGKSTQIKRLRAYLEETGRVVRQTLEPGGSELGVHLRRILLDPKNSDLDRTSELFLYLADRAQHVASVIRPALARNEVVLCDRFADSTVVYQGYGRGLDPKLLHQLNDVAVAGIWPDLTILLDLDPETGLKRALTRNVKDNKAATEGRFEAESIEFHTRIREGYLTWAALNRPRFAVVDASGTPDEVFAKISRLMDDLIKEQEK
jgi:dTMP kinase